MDQFAAPGEGGEVRARDADLSTLWEGVCLRYEQVDQPIPWYLWLVYRFAHRVFRWGAA